MEVRHETIGPQHEYYRNFALAKYYKKQGKFNEAIKLYQEMFDTEKPDHKIKIHVLVSGFNPD